MIASYFEFICLVPEGHHPNPAPQECVGENGGSELYWRISIGDRFSVERVVHRIIVHYMRTVASGIMGFGDAGAIIFRLFRQLWSDYFVTGMG